MAEKYLKAILQENGLSIPKTHSLADILAICIKIDASIQMIQMDLNVLEGYAVNFRYPGQSADKLDAKSAEIVRICVRSKLEL
jgi:HEPN domain-containing protein